jgi:o-succinylbenzoate synthase
MRCELDRKILTFSSPVNTASGAITERASWIVSIVDEAGRIGLGEAAPLAGFGGEHPDECLQALRASLKLLSKEFLFAWMTRGRADAMLGAMEPLLAKTPCARSAIEGALIDLLAQRNETSIARLLAESSPTSDLNVNMLLDDDTVDQLTLSAQFAAGEGFATFKIKVGTDLAKDLCRVFAVRDAVGSEARLRVDVNGGWTQAQAASFIDQARDADIEFIEQPLPADDLAGLSALRKQTGIRIAVDESVRSPGDVARVAAAQAADVVVLKPMFLGGWRPTRQAAQLAQTHGLGIVVTTVLDGSIGRAHATHMASALGLKTFAHGLATGDRLSHDLTTEPLMADNGSIHVNGKAGLGIGIRT